MRFIALPGEEVNWVADTIAHHGTADTHAFEYEKLEVFRDYDMAAKVIQGLKPQPH